MPEWLGKTIGQVRIEKLLAGGGMAEVYLGLHLTLQRPVAVKVLHSYIEEEPMLLERFRREARAVAGLRHPNIVRIYDFDTTNNHPYIVMEYLNGPTLASVLGHLRTRKKRLPVDQVAGLLEDLAAALDYAHGQGVIHRDIKPGNILLHHTGEDIVPQRPLPGDVEAILTDFGLVRFMDAATRTMTGFISATPTYASPEQARGVQMDHRTDLYSLGVVLYEMLAGHVPFEADNPVAMLHMHIHSEPPPIPGIPPRLQEVVDRALQKKPDDRFQTSKEMASALDLAIDRTEPPEGLQESLPPRPSGADLGSPIAPSAYKPAVPAAPETPPTKKLDSPATYTPKSKPVPPAMSRPRDGAKRPQAWPWKWIGAGLAAVLCIALVAAGALRAFSAAALFPKAGPTEVPVNTIAVTSPIPSAASHLPDTSNMVEVAGGTYEVGTDLLKDGFHVAPRDIQLGSYWIDRFPTTNAEYQQYIAAAGASRPMVWPGKPKQPVRGVTWEQAAAYCAWADKRLPDEAEWEAAGRGPGRAPQLYPWGRDATAGGAALELPSEDTYEVGSQPLNVSALKVYDLVGNVWEWVGEPYAALPNGFRVLHGGRYGNPQDLAYRLVVPPGDSVVQYAGFRCAIPQAGAN